MSNLLGVPCPCPTIEPCGCSILEHLAWEAGWAAGLQAVDPAACPFTGIQHEAWMAGHSAAWCGKQISHDV